MIEYQLLVTARQQLDIPSHSVRGSVRLYEETEYTRIVEKQSSARETDTGSVEANVAAQAADGLETVVSADYQVVGRVGTPGKKVVEYAEEVDARYLVVGGGARSPVGKALFGSETQSIL